MPSPSGASLIVSLSLVGAGLVGLGLGLRRLRRSEENAPKPESAEPELRWFVEYREDPAPVSTKTGFDHRRARLVLTPGLALIAAGLGATVAAVRAPMGSAPAQEAPAVVTEAKPVEQAPAATSATLSVALSGAQRGAPVVIPRGNRRLSLFADPSHDLDRDGRISAEDRAHVHAETPLFVLASATIDPAALDEPTLAWLVEALAPIGGIGRLTVFVRATDAAASTPARTLAAAAYLGLSIDQAPTDVAKAHRTFTSVPLPSGWSWSSYPWGLREATGRPTDAAIGAAASAATLWDASIVVKPTSPGAKSWDAPWPFTLHAGMPSEIKSSALGGAPAIGAHSIWAVPLAAIETKAGFVAPTDRALVGVYGCASDGAIEAASRAAADALAAHYRGNRAPMGFAFDLAVDPVATADQRACARRIGADFTREVARRADEGWNVRGSAVPELLAWLGRMRSP
jgi:hypothetical protein